MSPPASQDGTGRHRWLCRALAGIAGAVMLAAALWLCVAVLPNACFRPCRRPT
jgi:hypothetical protein